MRACPKSHAGVHSYYDLALARLVCLPLRHDNDAPDMERLVVLPPCVGKVLFLYSRGGYHSLDRCRGEPLADKGERTGNISVLRQEHRDRRHCFVRREYLLVHKIAVHAPEVKITVILYHKPGIDRAHDGDGAVKACHLHRQLYFRPA